MTRNDRMRRVAEEYTAGQIADLAGRGLLQPLVGRYTDRRPMPYSLAAGMGLTLVGLLLLSVSHTYLLVVLSAGIVGLGSAVFHPEASAGGF